MDTQKDFLHHILHIILEAVAWPTDAAAHAGANEPGDLVQRPGIGGLVARHAGQQGSAQVCLADRHLHPSTPQPGARYIQSARNGRANVMKSIEATKRVAGSR